MNVYILHESPVRCARSYDDQTLSRMINAAACNLAAAHRVLDGRPDKIFSPNRKYRFQYPWVLPEEIGKSSIVPLLYDNPRSAWISWCTQGTQNYIWLMALYIAGCREFLYRKNTSHGMAHYLPYLQNTPSMMFEDEGTPWPNGSIEEHRETYIDLTWKWKVIWTRRERPIWYAS